MKIKKYNKKVKRQYEKYMKNEKKAFNEGKRDSHPATCEGNLW